MNQLNHLYCTMDNAVKYGLEEAIILESIIFWIKRYAANETHQHDGRTWVYNSKKAWADMFPCFSEKQIRRIFDSLLEQGVIIKGNYNSNKYDRTNWYALSDEIPFGVSSTGPNGPIVQTDESNHTDQEGQPIPCNNHDSTNDKNKHYLFLSELLRDKIKQSGTDGVLKESHLKKWCNDFRLMVEQDGRTEQQIIDTIEAIFRDSFWCKVVRSADKLRKNWNGGKLDRLAQNGGEGSQDQDYEALESPKSPWERFKASWDTIPAVSVRVYLGGIWEQLYNNKAWLNRGWPDEKPENNEIYRQAWEIMEANKKDKNRAFELIQKLFEENCGY